MFDYIEGRLPLLVSIPHDGWDIPEDITARMTELGRSNHDADWHVRRLYEFATHLGAHVVSARYSRYVVDLNRDPADTALYPGAVNTGIVPHLAFDGRPLYVAGEEPNNDEVSKRIDTYWRPYHSKIESCLQELCVQFGGAVLFDAHSINAVVPRLFEGRLPDFNLGTSAGKSASTELEDLVYSKLDAADGYSSVLNGRFKGGYITRQYGSPAQNCHTLQLELSQTTYMQEEPPFDYLVDRAERVVPHLQAAVTAAADWSSAAYTESN
jgi:N-formylglutamate deformylase